MEMINVTKNITSLIAAAVFALATATGTQAATISSTTVAPTPDGADLFNLVTPETSNDIINGDRPAVGQTFTTLSNSTGYMLSALTFYNVRAIGSTGGNFNLRLGTVSGTSFTQTAADTLTIPNGSLTLSGSGGDYITYTLTAPLQLDPNTQYGIDLVRSGSGNFLSWGENANTNYLGGESYVSPPNGLGGPTITLGGSDRIFLLDLTANPLPPVPEPSTMTLAALGLLGLIHKRRRRK